MILNEGEVRYDKCNGSGFCPDSDPLLCRKCNGKGKLDWVSNAMGNLTPRYLKASISSENRPYCEEKFVNEMAKEIAKKIDEEILESLSDPDSLKQYIRRVKY